MWAFCPLSILFGLVKSPVQILLRFDSTHEQFFEVFKFRNFQNFIISNILFDDVFTDWLSKRTVYFSDMIKLFFLGS